MTPLQSKALEIAAAAIGVKEDPLGSNRGPEVDQYLRSVGLDPAGHYPWCAAFAYWCFWKSAAQLATGAEYRFPIPNPCPRTGSALGLWNHSRPEWRSNAPTVGAVFVLDFGHGTGHVGFVESIEGAWLTTIEGNSNEGGSREGIGVFRRKRATASINRGFLNFGA